MTPKNSESPNGMVCPVCGQDKTPYNFFNYAAGGKWSRAFFVSGYQPGVCWDCAGDYRCIECGEIKAASEFRVQGRVCHSCKATPHSHAPTKTRETAVKPVLMPENDENGALWGVLE